MVKINKKTVQKPFLKWVGGKTQIMENVFSHFPEYIENYHEIFLGGGSVLFTLLSLEKQGKIKINGNINVYDLNPVLINVYKNIQKNYKELYKRFENYMGVYDKISGDFVNRKPTNEEESKSSKESYYYWLRNKFNECIKEEDYSSLKCSSLFLFLNKTCFRGMYREGPSGFNVPYGHYKKTPKIFTLKDFENISLMISNVKFNVSSYEVSLLNVKEGDFVYLDPPYFKENEKSFVGYTKKGFNVDCHNELFDLIIKLKADFVLSNSNVEYVLDYFKDFNFEKVVAKRAINSKNPGEKTKELIIYSGLS